RDRKPPRAGWGKMIGCASQDAVVFIKPTLQWPPAPIVVPEVPLPSRQCLVTCGFQDLCHGYAPEVQVAGIRWHTVVKCGTIFGVIGHMPDTRLVRIEPRHQ